MVGGVHKKFKKKKVSKVKPSPCICGAFFPFIKKTKKQKQKNKQNKQKKKPSNQNKQTNIKTPNSGIFPDFYLLFVKKMRVGQVIPIR